MQISANCPGLILKILLTVQVMCRLIENFLDTKVYFRITLLVIAAIKGLGH